MIISNLFDRSSAKLVCPQCGHIFINLGGSWEDMENHAARVITLFKPHKCGLSASDRELYLDIVKNIMKKLRIQNPSMTFDEQQKVYGELIAQYNLLP